MKLNRDKVIAALQEKRAEAAAVKEAPLSKIVKEQSKILDNHIAKMRESISRCQAAKKDLKFCENIRDLEEVLKPVGTDDRLWQYGHAKKVAERTIKQIDAELRLLELTDTKEVSIRVNSNLGFFLGISNGRRDYY